jgi:hypothetical protein
MRRFAVHFGGLAAIVTMPTLRLTLALLCGAALAGCASGPAFVPSAPQLTARIALQNLSSHRWRVTLQGAAASDRKVAHLAPHETTEFTCAAGDYAIEQARLSNDGAVVLETRRLTARFEAGEAYEWPLLTVLSSAPPADGKIPP